MAIPEGKTRCELVLSSKELALLDQLLKAAGMTRSGFIDTLIIKTVQAMKLESVPDINKMTINELYGMFKGLKKMLSMPEIRQ